MMGFNPPAAVAPYRFGLAAGVLGGTLEATLLLLERAGFMGTELSQKHLYADPRGPFYVADLLRTTGLSVSAFQMLRQYEGMEEPHKRQVLALARQAMEQMQWIGANVLVLCANSHPECVNNRARVLDDLHRLAELAREHNVLIAYEPIIMSRWYSDYRDAWSLVREANHGHLGLLLDSFHMFVGEQPLDAIAQIPGHKIFAVQLSEPPGAHLPVAELARHYRLFPGEGHGSSAEFLACVAATGYSGLYSLEVLNDYYMASDPAAVVARAKQSLIALEPCPVRLDHRHRIQQR